MTPERQQVAFEKAQASMRELDQSLVRLSNYLSTAGQLGLRGDVLAMVDTFRIFTDSPSPTYEAD